MSQYVDGYVLPVKKDKIEDYRRMAEIGRQVWLEHGALDYRECVGEDLDAPFGLSFPRGIQTNPDETVVFSYIVFSSREERDRINAAVMKDERLTASADPENMPFDCARMIYGGFTTIVGA